MTEGAKKQLKNKKRNEFAILLIIVLFIVSSLAVSAWLGLSNNRQEHSLISQVEAKLAEKDLYIKPEANQSYIKLLTEDYVKFKQGGNEPSICYQGGYDLSGYIGQTATFTVYDTKNAYADGTQKTPLQVWVVHQNNKLLCLFLSQKSGGAYIYAPSILQANDKNSP